MKQERDREREEKKKTHGDKIKFKKKWIRNSFEIVAHM